MALTTTPTCGGDFPDVIAKETSLTSTAIVDVFDGAKSVHTISLSNTGVGSNIVYVRAYNSGSVDPANDVPDLKIKLAASSTLNVIIADGLSFTTAFSLRCSTGSQDTNTGAPGGTIAVALTGS